MLECILPLSSATVSSTTRAVALHGKLTSEEFTGRPQGMAEDKRIGIVELETYGRGAECEAGQVVSGCGLKRTTISSINIPCEHRQEEVTYMVLRKVNH